MKKSRFSSTQIAGILKEFEMADFRGSLHLIRLLLLMQAAQKLKICYTGTLDVIIKAKQENHIIDHTRPRRFKLG